MVAEASERAEPLNADDAEWNPREAKEELFFSQRTQSAIRRTWVRACPSTFRAMSFSRGQGRSRQ